MFKSIYILEPLTDGCIDWIDANIFKGDWQPYAGQVVVEHRYIEDIVEALSFNGFKYQQDFLVH